ncbi:hypothetical protein, partial [uncultured Acidaminococcus sp.]|uniref:hypothetical protein n=1 Tax=uncultured Acidaminococcus sp. TaxID=352152 RepID=UPI002943D8EF
ESKMLHLEVTSYYLRRWGQGILSGRQDQIPEGPMQAGRPYGRPTFADLTENLVVPVPPTETP